MPTSPYSPCCFILLVRVKYQQLPPLYRSNQTLQIPKMSSRNTSVSSLNSDASGYSSSTSFSDADICEESLISGLDHVNLLVPCQTLHLAHAFYSGSLGLSPIPVPSSNPFKGLVGWFDIAGSGQQIHIMSAHHLGPAQLRAQTESQRHFCFKIRTLEKLQKLQGIIWQLYERGDEGAPTYCDEPMRVKGNSREQADVPDTPTRFFARDYAGNRLEFSL